MKKTMSGWAAALMVLASAGSLVAHHSLANYDTKTAVTVTGTIYLIERINPHSIIFVDQKAADGQIQRWAVEGPGILQLERKGISKDAFKVGDVIVACGYVPKEGANSQRTINTEPISLSLKATTPKSVTGRIMDGEMITAADGQKQVWSDYGFHKCLGADFKDLHTQ